MITMVSKILTILFIILNIICSFVAGETGCPEAEDIAPCKCTRRPTTRLICEGIEMQDQLSHIFTISERYTFHQVHIVNSSFLVIPSDLFKKATIEELYLRNSTLQTLFPELEAEDRHLYKLQMESVKVTSTLTAGNLSLFTNLKEISVYYSMVSSIPRSFGESLPKSLKKFTLYGTKTKGIAKGALNQVPNLNKFAVESGILKALSRDMFPRPFYVRTLYFNDNKISTIPEDLFTEMPNLQFLSMVNNAISTIPEAAFAGRTVNVPYFQFEGNPLQCDCQLLWVIKDKPEILGGACSSPEKFNGRKLRDLLPAELRC